MTRPDVASTMSAVVRHTYNLAANEGKAVRKVIAYLEGAEDLDVVLRRGDKLKLSLFTDVDYADRRSVSGVSVMLTNDMRPKVAKFCEPGKEARERRLEDSSISSKDLGCWTHIRRAWMLQHRNECVLLVQ